MIRRHENPIALRAGALSLLVHIVLLALLLFSFNWKAVQPLTVAQVELWDSLPTPEPVKPVVPDPVLDPPKPVIQEQSKPDSPPDSKVDIQIKKKTVVESKKEKPVEKPKPEPDLKAKELEKKRLEQEKQEKLKKLQQELLAEDNKLIEQEHKKEVQASANAQSAAALKGEQDKYIALVSSKIRPYVNKQLCGNGKPELTYEIGLLPTGEILGSPKLIKPSGIAACDEAVDRAIRQANPLPKPSAELLSLVRELRLKFRPNDDN